MAINNNLNKNVSGDLLWSQTIYGTDGLSDKVIAGEIRCYADSTVTAGVIPGRLEFWTATTGGTLTKAFTVDSSQKMNMTGGVGQATAPAGFNNIPPATVTTGTDTAFANGTQFVSSIFVPVNKTLTGAAYLVGSVGGTDKVYAALYDASGALVANSSVAGGGATAGTAAQIQTLDFTSTVAVKGPAMYYVGISGNTGTAKIRLVPAHLQAGIFAGSVAQTHGTVAAITAPTTFTADKAPYVYVY